MKTKDKKVVSPFEFAIMEIADPESAKNYRAETQLEKAKRLIKEFSEIMFNIKIKKP